INNIEVAELLLKNGANPNAMSFDGQRPLSIARTKAPPGGSSPVLQRNLRGVPGPSPLAGTVGGLGNLVVGTANSGSPPNDMVDMLLKHGADELLLRQQVISVTRASRNYDTVYFRKGTNGFNRHTLYELVASLYARRGGGLLSFP